MPDARCAAQHAAAPHSRPAPLPASPRPQFFLLSKAGTHGINLVSCRRIVVLEEHWNPVFNLQVRLPPPAAGPQARGARSHALCRGLVAAVHAWVAQSESARGAAKSRGG